MPNDKRQLALAIRNHNGGFDSFSEGIEFHELIDLIQQSSPAVPAIIHNFAPVIQHLDQLRVRHEQQKIEEAYTSLFITWQEATSYDDREALVPMHAELVRQSTALLSSLKTHLENAASSLLRAEAHSKAHFAKELARDAHLYITALLCYTHSKATLQVSSFKKDSALTALAIDLLSLIQKFYFHTVGYQGNGRDFSRDSLIYSLAMNRHEELPSLLEILPNDFSSEDLRLQYLDLHPDNQIAISTEWGPQHVPGLTWQRVNSWDLEAAKILRNVLRKAQYVVELIDTLKNEDVKWNADEALAKKLVEHIEQSLQQTRRK